MSASPTITFKDCLTSVRKIPFGSATDELLHWTTYRGVKDVSVLDVKNASVGDKSTTSGSSMNFSAEAIQHTLARICVTLALPVISTLGVSYNLACGTTRFITGCVAHLKKQDKEEIRQEFNAAFTHYLTAVYDFSIGYFFGMRQIGSILALSAGLLPNYGIPFHVALFAKAEIGAENAKTISDFKLAPCGVKKGADKLTDFLLPGEEHKNMTFVDRLRFMIFGKGKTA